MTAEFEPRLHPKYQRSQELGDEITELCAYLYAATYRLLVLIREFDEQELWGLPGIASCAQWLNWKVGIGMNAAREKVRVARALGDLPLTSASFAKGEISYSKVRAITRVGTPANEEVLLHIARNGTAHHLETVVRGYRRAKALNETDTATAQHEGRGISYLWDDDGSLVIRGRLPAEVGAMVVKALDKAIRDMPQEPTSETGERQPIVQKRADALAGMCESYLAHGPQASSSADRYQVMLHVSAETLDGGDESDVTAVTSAQETSFIEHGPHVSAETSRRLCCDASLSAVIEGKNGEPISIGRKSRVIPPPMRRALNARDGGCRFPGCTHRHFVDGHHIQHWSEGGETSLDNLVLLCRLHHRMVHEQGFGCRTDSDGRLVFTTPGGTEIPQSGWHPPEELKPLLPELARRLEDQLEDAHIDAKTCACRWDGVPMDRGLAVELVCRRDGF
ncbi:MAG: DUF222 domain-containing protein [Xanthomonadales bacterium]|nr:DUF222 domain-containing protein [Xanthomonadales bacterium]